MKVSEQLPRKMECIPSDRPLRIGFVYSRLPFPMMRGDQMTVAHLLSFLGARGHAVDFFTLNLDGEMSPVQEQWLDETCSSVHIYTQSRVNRIFGLLRGALRGMPLQVGMFWNRRMAEDIRSAVADGEYDLVYCYYPRTAPAVPTGREASGTPNFLALQLSQTLNTRRMALNEPRFLKRMLYSLEARLMGRYESRVWSAFDRVVLIGPADVEAVREECRRRKRPEIDNWIYGAHGTDVDKYVVARPAEIVSKRIVFSGSMLYPPNIQAVLWFAEQVWPRILEAEPDATFVIQGRDPAPQVRVLDGQMRISVTGTVPDVGEIIRSAEVCVNPMLAAGGMQNKLIEYMASGKSVVATSIANEGIRAPAGTIFIEDEPDRFADSVVRLLRNPDLSAWIGARAAEYVRTNWTWEKHFLDLESEFEAAVTTNRIDGRNV